jgi:hypothetical protein
MAACVLAPIGSAYAGTLTLKARAGLGGLGRSGRWAPVRVSVDNTDRDFRGDIVISWGDAVVRRALTLGSPARADIVAYIRSADVRDVMSIRLESGGATLQSIDAPIRLASTEDDVSVCVTWSESAATTGECTATISAASLPRVMWGYDAVDRVRWQGMSPDMLEGDQRIAFEQWTATRTLDEAGIVRTPPRPLLETDPGGRSITLVETVMSLYVGLLVVGAVSARLWHRPLVVYAAVIVAGALGSAVTVAAGRFGPGAAIVVTHSSTVQQLPRGGSIVSMKASAQYPTFDAFRLRAKMAAAAVETQGPRAAMQFDESGEPMLPGVFGLATRQPFTLDGIINFSPFRIARRNGAMTVANASTFEYRNCHFSDGVSRRSAGTLPAGRTIDAPSDLGPTAFISCTLAATPVEFADPRYPVNVEGATDVTAYLDASVGAGAR